MIDIPSYVTHYHPAEDRPFQNLSDLSDDEATQVIRRLVRRGRADPRHKRVYGPIYMAYRRRVEAKLRALYVDSGGRPVRVAPHYFVLGSSKWFEGVYPDARSVTIPLDQLPKYQMSFTYPDSAVSMRIGAEFGLPEAPARPYHEKVFRLEQLPEIVSRYGLPRDGVDQDYQNYHLADFEKYIEVQLWCDEPVQHLLG